MLPKPRRPREKRIAPLTPVTYSISGFCDMTGLSRTAVLRSMDDGTLRTVKIGNRRLILDQQPHMSRADESRAGTDSVVLGTEPVRKLTIPSQIEPRSRKPAAAQAPPGR